MPEPAHTPGPDDVPGPNSPPDPGGPTVADLQILAQGALTLIGRLEGSTNYAMLVQVAWPGRASLDAVYKPTAGERPLHDFPSRTLTRREVAASLGSDAIG